MLHSRTGPTHYRDLLLLLLEIQCRSVAFKSNGQLWPWAPFRRCVAFTRAVCLLSGSMRCKSNGLPLDGRVARNAGHRCKRVTLRFCKRFTQNHCVLCNSCGIKCSFLRILCPALKLILVETQTRIYFVLPTLWLLETPIQWVPGAFSLGVKRPEREADHSPKNTPTLAYAFMA
jgi:hypothetical protein